MRTFTAFKWLAVQGVLMVLIVSSCSSARDCSTAFEAGTERVARCLLGEEIRARVERAKLPFDSTQLATRAETSSVIPGLTFRWGFYSPARDAYISVVAGVYGDTVLLLHSARDWTALLTRTDWRPSDQRQAMQICWEIVSTISRRADGTYSPILYERPETLTGQNIAVEDRLLALAGEIDLAPPSVKREIDGWRVRLWAVDYEGAVNYECVIGPDMRVTLTPQDSLGGVILLHP